MRENIENQKIRTFIHKIKMQWFDEIDRCEFLQPDLICICLKPNVTVLGLRNILEPKIYLFVDFQTAVKLRFIDDKMDLYTLEVLPRNRKVVN